MDEREVGFAEAFYREPHATCSDGYTIDVLVYRVANGVRLTTSDDGRWEMRLTRTRTEALIKVLQEALRPPTHAEVDDSEF